ncbi:MAG: hypothetical protein JSR98_03950 [Proteobacteria bacterium]|nr:hypothetical protein [Pseudomonadota bacterium]
MSNFLPPSTNGDYTGARSAVWFLGLVTLLTIGPGLIHSFLPDGGAGVIAGLNMGDKRDLVIGTFRWEGATQLALGVCMLAVVLRYQPLTPLFLAAVIVERGLMSLQAWVIAPPADGHHPPEHFGSPVTVVLALVFLALSLRPRARA